MKNISANLIVKLIKKVIGRGRHQLHEPLFSNKELKYLTNTIKQNFVSTAGKYVNKFEEKVKLYTKAKFAIAVVNGTQAIYISLKVSGVKENEEVLVPALTFIGTANAVSYLGAKPHFIDSHINNFGIDCVKLEKYLKSTTRFKGSRCVNKQTGNIISAIIPVHVFGHPCNIQSVIKIAKKYNLKVIEDAAEALGSFHKKRHLGTFGDLGCFSFNGNKIITTGGGGMVVTNNKKIAKKGKHLTTTAKTKLLAQMTGKEVTRFVRSGELILGIENLIQDERKRASKNTTTEWYDISWIFASVLFALICSLIVFRW